MIGTVLFYVNHPNKAGGYGFIVPDDTPNMRETNYWFGPKALGKLTVKSGDRVEFDAGNYKPGKGPQASHVRLCKNEGNENEHQSQATTAERSSGTRSGAIHQARSDQAVVTIPGQDDY